MSVELVTDLNAALLAAGDASNTRTVYAVVIALGVIGAALLILGIWLIKQTKPEPELLAPLERMDDRSWRKQDPAQMRRDLDSLRPEGARPVHRERSVPDVDADFARSRPALATFDDLQAQLAADTRRASTGPNDPLLAAQAQAAIDDDDADDGDEGGDGAAADTADHFDAGGGDDADPDGDGNAVRAEPDGDGDRDDGDGNRSADTGADDDDTDDDDTDGDDTGDIEVDEFGVKP